MRTLVSSTCLGRLLAFAVLGLAFLAPAAYAETEIGFRGSGAGQIQSPRGVAVDQSSGLLYVADNGNNRIAVFDAGTGAFVKAFGWGVADGTTPALQVCTTTCFKGIAGNGKGQLDGNQGIAVDNNPASPAFHDIYVFENANHRVQRFTAAGAFVWAIGDSVNATTNGDLCTAASGNTCRAGTPGDTTGQFNSVLSGGIAVGPAGTVYVADQTSPGPTGKSRVQKYEPSGAPAGQLLVEAGTGSGIQTGVAVDAGGAIYLATSSATGGVRKYGPTGTELFHRMPSFNVNGLGISPSGDIYVSDNTIFSDNRSIEEVGIYEFDSTGAQVRTFYGALKRRVPGLAPFSSSTGDVFAVEELSAELGAGPSSGVRHVAFPPPGPVVYPAPGATVASPLGNTKATFNARINPEGKATTYHFEYITNADYEAAGNSFGAGTLKTSEVALPGAFTFAAAEACREAFVANPVPTPPSCELRTAQAPVTGLSPETVYRFRAVAGNADGSGRAGPAVSFETKPPIELGDAWSTAVGTDSATLHGEANPLEVPASGYFEYVDEQSFEASGFVAATKIPDVDGGASPLDFGAGAAMVQRTATLFSLQPDTSYRYRLVATDHCKADPEVLCIFTGPALSFTTFAPASAPQESCPNAAFRTGPAAFLPDCRGYEMVSPSQKLGSSIEALYNNLNFSAALDQAAANGNSITYSGYQAFGEAGSAPYTNQYLARRDAATGWVTESISPVREGSSLMTYESSQLDRQYKAFSDDLCNGWLIQDADPVLAPGAIAGYPGLYRRDNCAPGTGTFEALSIPEIPGTDPPNLPPGKFIPEPQGMSADGSSVIFTLGDNLTSDASPQPLACAEEVSPSAETCERRLYEAGGGQIRYVCILPNGNPNPGGCSAGQTSTSGDSWKGRANNLANVISDDGSRIFWTAARSGPGPLYVRIDRSQTVAVSSSPSTRFWTASADGSTAVYSIDEKLFEFDVDAETATPIAEGFKGFAGASDDASRLYFVSTKVLSGEEENNFGAKAVAGGSNLYLHTAGDGFRFIGTLLVSDVQGFGNPVEQVPAARVSRVGSSGEQIAFMAAAPLTGYDNKDAQAGALDMEVFLYDATADGGSGALACASCNPSGARPEGRKLTLKFLTERRAAAYIPTYQSQLYGQRVLSEDGNRLYFNSFESLVSRDTNGQEDVYQWRALGAAGCSAQSPTHSEVSGGCVDLISSGQSPQGSVLVDISADGKDVFFKTNESLVGQDPGLRDIYDARVGGGFPSPPTPPAACEGEACAPAAAAPSDPTPSSAAFRGPGDAAGQRASRKACPKGKRKVRRAGNQRCVKPAKKSHRKNVQSGR